MNKTIFIDRDGVINRDLLGYVERREDFEFIPGTLNAIRLLTERDFTIVIISNQAGVGDGIFTREALDDVTDYMLDQIALSGGTVAGVYYCVHGKNDGCDCRKPKTGLFQQAGRDIPAFEKNTTFFIGDKLSDIIAGKCYGLKTALVLTGYGKREQDKITDESKPDIIAENLEKTVALILQKETV